MSCLEFLAFIDAVSANSDSTSLCCHNHWDLLIFFVFYSLPSYIHYQRLATPMASLANA